MKTRISAFLLVAVMLLGAFSMTVSAAPMPTLQSYITNVLATNPTGKVIIALPSDTVVDTATTIPVSISVYVGPDVKLLVYAAVTVYGELRSAVSSNIILYTGGSVTYSTAPNPNINYWTHYDPACPWTINPPQGPYCVNCNTNTKIWCFTCSTYHCPNCTPHYSQNALNYCTVHHTEKYHCAKCNVYYCPACAGGYHYYTDITSPCVIYYDGGMVNGIYPYYYYNYVYIPGYGWIATNTACIAPAASIPDGATADKDTKVILTSATPGAVIYYTTNGTVPGLSSAKYTEPIIITKDVTIHAIAVHPGIYNSPVAKFSYKVKAAAAGSSFKDISDYPGLVSSLDKLIAKKVISASAAFNPSGKISWSDVSAWFTALGVKVTNANIKPETAFADANKLTYEEMILTCYKIMRADKLIATPRNQGSVTIKKLLYSEDITTLAIYKAAYASLIENNVLYGLYFKPQDPANRAYLATAVAWAAAKVK